MTNFFESKAKNIMAIIFSALFSVMIILNSNIKFSYFSNLRYAVNSIVTTLSILLLPVFLVFLIILNKKPFAFKKSMLPIAFGLMLVKSAITLYYSVMNTITVFDGEIHVTVLSLLIITALSFVAIAVMFVGTLGDFKLVGLFKYAALSQAVILTAGFVLEFAYLGGFRYFQRLPYEYTCATIMNLIYLLSQILFYIGLFILFPAKKKAKEEITA